MQIIEIELTNADQEVIDAYKNLNEVDRADAEADYIEVYELAELFIQKIKEAKEMEFYHE